MHGCELIELAALLASSGRILVSSDRSIRSEGLEEYWVASRCRLDRWGTALASYADETNRRRNQVAGWQATRSVVEEILASEVLTRIWTALCCGKGKPQQSLDNETASICRNVFAGHLEASARAMRMVAQTDRIGIEEAVSLNRLRRRNERWNDLLLSLCRDICDVREFAYCQKRVADVALSGNGCERSVVLAAVQIGCRDRLATEPANPESNRRIATAVLACIGSACFESGSGLHSEFISRLYDTTADLRGRLTQASPINSASTEAWGIDATSQRHKSQRNRF